MHAVAVQTPSLPHCRNLDLQQVQGVGLPYSGLAQYFAAFTPRGQDAHTSMRSRSSCWRIDGSLCSMLEDRETQKEGREFLFASLRATLGAGD